MNNHLYFSKLSGDYNNTITSFCGFGIRIREYDLKKSLNCFSLMLPHSEKKAFDVNFINLLDDITTRHKLKWKLESRTDWYFIGIEFCDAFMNETLTEIRNKVRKALEEIGISGNIEFIKEAWIN